MSVAKEELPTAVAVAAKCQKLSVSYVPTSELRPHPRNARAHSNTQIKQVVASIKEFGFTNPLLVDRNNTVVAGHGRLEAAKRLSMPEVPILRLSDLTEDQIRAYLIPRQQSRSQLDLESGPAIRRAPAPAEDRKRFRCLVDRLRDGRDRLDHWRERKQNSR